MLWPSLLLLQSRSLFMATKRSAVTPPPRREAKSGKGHQGGDALGCLSKRGVREAFCRFLLTLVFLSSSSFSDRGIKVFLCFVFSNEIDSWKKEGPLSPSESAPELLKALEKPRQQHVVKRARPPYIHSKGPTTVLLLKSQTNQTLLRLHYKKLKEPYPEKKKSAAKGIRLERKVRERVRELALSEEGKNQRREWFLIYFKLT